MTRLGRALLVLVVALLASSCAVDATLDVRVRENGSGVVRLVVSADADAVRAAESGGLPLEQAVRLDDLGAAGWAVDPWVRAEDGSASIVLSKQFESTEQVAGIISEASGDNGPLRLSATRERGFLATDYGVDGRVDLEHVTTGVPTDAELLANLTAQSVDPTVIDQQLLAQVKASFGLKVVVHLPGGATKTFTAKPGAITRVDALASVRDTVRLVFLLAALVFVILAVVLWRRGGRPRRRRATPRPPTKPRPEPTARPKPGPGGLEGPRRRPVPPRPRDPHDPRPHVPEPHLPHEEQPHGPHDPRPHVPQPNRPQPRAPGPPGRPRPGAPPPPRRRPGRPG